MNDVKTMDEVKTEVEERIDAAVHTEEIEATGDSLVGKVKEIVHQGNIRRLTIRDNKGRSLVDIPLTVGVVGVLVAPQLAAIGAIAALVTECSLVVEKLDEV
jgi:hypothetical protein